MKTNAYTVYGFPFTLADLIVNVGIIFIVVLWYYIKWNNRHIDKLASRLNGPKAYPIIGAAHHFFGSPHHILKKIIKINNDYGPEPFKLWLGPKFTVVLLKPEDVQIVLNNSMALDRSLLRNFFSNVLGNGLTTASDTTMGLDVGTELKSDFKSFTEYFEKAVALNTMRLYRPWYYPDIVFSIYLRLTGQYTIFDKVKELPNRVIEERKEIFTKKKIASISNDHNYEEKGSKIFLDILMELNDIGENFSDEEIRDEVVTMIAAGSESSAVTNCFCLLLLAIHQDIQDKVYNELNEVFGNGDQTCTYEDINRLVYLEQVINETLRMFPVVPMFFRTIQEDIKIFSGNITIPKGTECVICPTSMHWMPELYPNPSIFNPENFSSENISKRHKYSFLAFSGGPRGCIGYKYAILSTKVLLSTFLRNFSVHTDIKVSDINTKYDVILRSSNGYPVTIQPRTNV